MWEQHWNYWASQRGVPTEMRKIKYLGLRGWYGHIQKKTIDGIDYAGEIYDCITRDGERVRGTFRVLYAEVINTDKTNIDNNEEAIRDITNYHTDGIAAYLSGNFRDYDNRQLKKKQLELKSKIERLKEKFAELNNIDNSELKLGIQLYLRRLETPDHYTSKDWKNYANKKQILALL